MEDKKKFKIYIYSDADSYPNQLCTGPTKEMLKDNLLIAEAKLEIDESNFDIEFINDKQILEDNVLNSEDTKPHMLFIPGGHSEHYMNKLGKDGIAKIEKYVSDGGLYYGICAGTHLAAENMTFKDSFQKDGEFVKQYSAENKELLGIAKFNSETDLDDLPNESMRENGCLIKVSYKDKNDKEIVFYGTYRKGPGLKNNDGEELANFAEKDVFEDKIAAGHNSYGENGGEVVVCSFHPEWTIEKLYEEGYYFETVDGVKIDDDLKDENLKDLTDFCQDKFLKPLIDRYHKFNLELKNELEEKAENNLNKPVATAKELDGRLDTMKSSNPTTYKTPEVGIKPAPTPAPVISEKPKPISQIPTPKPPMER